MSFNSQPPKGGCQALRGVLNDLRGFNSQPPKGGCNGCNLRNSLNKVFQLTAAQRRLLSTSKSAKNQLITNILSLTYSDVREFGKYSARFCAIQPYK